MPARLNVTYDRLNDPSFLGKTRAISTGLHNNPFFGQPWPDFVPSLEKLDEAINRFQDAYLAALSGDKSKILLRNTVRSELAAIIRDLSRYLEMVAGGDPQKLMSTGYDLRKARAAGSAAGQLQAPQNFVVRHGDQRGVLVGKATRSQRAGSYEVHVASGDPTVEENWKHNGTYLHCSHIEMSGFDPGTMYSLRIRGVCPTGTGPWSTPFNIMAI